MSANTGKIKISIEVDGKTGVKTVRQLGDESKKAGEKGAKAFKKSKKSLGDYNKSADAATMITGKLAGAFAGLSATAALGGVVMLLKAGVLSLAEWERKLLRTEALIRATGNAAGLGAGELSDFAKQMDLATLGNRDEIMSAINVMQTFRSVTGDTFKRSIQLSQDLAEVLGTGLRSQAVQLGKALQDPVQGLTALQRVGVVFTAQQKEQIKTLVENNRQLEAQAKILDEIERQVGGAAQGAAGGLAGKMDTLSYQWTRFGEVLAEAGPVVRLTAAAIGYLSGSLDELSNSLEGSTVKESIAYEIAELESLLKLYEMTGGGTRINVDETRARIEALRQHQFRNIDMRDRRGDGPPPPPDDNASGSRTFLGAPGVERAMIEQAQALRQLKERLELQKALENAVADTYDIDAGVETFAEQMEAMSAELQAMTEETEIQAEKHASKMEDAFTGWAASYSRTLNDMLWESEITFDGILESFGRMLTQMAIQSAMTDMAGALSGSGGLIANWIGMATYQSPGTTLSTGAVVNPSGAVWNFGGGGYLGEDVVGIGRRTGQSYNLHADEYVLPADNLQGGAAPQVTINFENRSGVDLTPDIRIMQPSPGTIIASAVLRRKMTSRKWRQGMGVR